MELLLNILSNKIAGEVAHRRGEPGWPSETLAELIYQREDGSKLPIIRRGARWKKIFTEGIVTGIEEGLATCLAPRRVESVGPDLCQISFEKPLFLSHFRNYIHFSYKGGEREYLDLPVCESI